MAIKSKMVACRLSEDEYEQLMELLNIFESSEQEFFSNKVRSFIKVLSGRLYLDDLDYLRLRPIEGELSERQVEELEKALAQDLYASLLH
ncbi:hypothetical protein MUP77_09530 [Candidatus Bathyarchaeota archaeon]|nr:hypothetical protein [Candidatus Bathyarchaeota archaeon]